ncbi:hypothetical protein HYG77_36470 (plasmid) [Rhodococcus sp. ZPP]|uniref:hypothetical protein n=1 Tax=Rhodococcus TaxID=1827 RepID=UPI001AD887BF|nr:MULTISPECIES: hypothetical protein [Rhodococcus]MBO8150818.1 hypothetical protein [Rhodococcus erythropolis]QTJ70984.1 hypothetical protein HYG77_36470 [Rhodococcus sp. ZPP]
MTNNHDGDASGPPDDPGMALTGISVAVVAVSTSRSRTSGSARTRTPWVAMEDYAALIRERTPMRALHLPLTTGDPHVVADRVIGLGTGVSAVFVVGLGPVDSAAVAREVIDRGGPLVTSELDVLTVAVAAATITLLRRRGVPPRAGRVVITNSPWAPLLAPVLMASGVGDLSSWHEGDAEAFPLRRLMEHNDVLVDLAGCAPEGAAPGRTVAIPADAFTYGALVLPGLLSAVCGHGVPALTVDVVAACVRALALITPVDRELPALDDRLLVSAVARHAGRTIGHIPPFSNQHQ